jgi:hypothetical protein
VRFTQRADAGPSTADSEPACATDEVQQLAHGSPSLLLNRQCDHVVKGRLAPPSGACDCVTLSSTAASPYQNPTKAGLSHAVRPPAPRQPQDRPRRGSADGGGPRCSRRRHFCSTRAAPERSSNAVVTASATMQKRGAAGSGGLERSHSRELTSGCRASGRLQTSDYCDHRLAPSSPQLVLVVRLRLAESGALRAQRASALHQVSACPRTPASSGRPLRWGRVRGWSRSARRRWRRVRTMC